MSHRKHRVAELLQAEISSLLLREVNDPRLRSTSVSRIDVSPDLRHASVVLSHLGSEEDRAEAVQAAERAKGFLRTRLARRLRTMKVIPELHFELDRNAEYSQSMSDLLEDLDIEPETEESS